LTSIKLFSGKLRRRVHNLQRSVHHRNDTNKSHQNLLSEAAEQSSLDGFGPVAKEIMLNEIRNVRKNRHGHHFSDNIRAFALAVFFTTVLVHITF